MQIHIQRGVESFGPLSLEETTKYLARGDLLETDLAWHEGINDWAPLGELIRQLGETQPATESTKPGPKAEGEEPAIFGQGRYLREKVLGKGGQGEVWLAHDLQLERQVAIKQVNEQFAPGTMAYQSLKDEVQKSLELTHPNITRIYDLVDVPGESPFISMEYLEGEDLSVKIQQQEGGHFSWDEIEPYILSLCDALEYAHGQGMVHRDLKPANLIITDSGELKLTDMGIAEPAKDPEDLLDQEDFISGTPLYWSPQQSQGIKPQATDDIYSLGTTLYHLLTGRPPFLGENEEEITKQHLAKTPDDLQQVLKAEGHATQVPAYINQLVLKCLAKDPTSRPQGAGYIRDWIKAKGDPVVKRQKRIAMVSATLGVVALAMGGLAIWAWTQRTEAEEQRGIAETKQQQAEAAKEAETKQRKEADKQKEIALQEKAKADEQSYFNAIALAKKMIEENVYDQAEAILWATPKEHRNWEWGCCLRLCHPELLTLKGHGALVLSVAFSPDGRRVVTVSNYNDKTAKIWDAETGKELLTLRGASRSAAFSPDGRRVVTGGWDGNTKIWDAETGKELLTLRGANGSAAFSPDGRRVVTGGWGGNTKIWDAESGAELLSLKEYVSYVQAVAFSPDGRRVVTGNGGAKIWDAESGLELLTLKGHAEIAAAAFSPDGRRLVTGSQDSTVKIWDAENGQELLVLKDHIRQVFSVAFSPDSQRLITAGGRTAKIRDAKSGRELLALKGHLAPGLSGAVSSVAFSPDGRRVVTGGEDKTAKIWAATDGSERLPFKGTPNTHGRPAFSPNGRRVLVGGKIWDAKSGRELLAIMGKIGPAAFSPDGLRVVMGGIIWDAKSGRELLALKGYVGSIINGVQSQSSVAFFPDGRRVLTGSSTDVKSYNPKDGKVVVTGSNTTKIWDASTGTELLTLKGQVGPVYSVALSPDGQRVVTGGEDKTAKIWDAKSGTELLTLKGHADRVNSVAFSPDSRRVVTSSDDKTAKIWDTTDGSELMSLRSHVGSIRSAVFSPDGRRVVTVSAGTDLFPEGRTKIWNVENGQEIMVFEHPVGFFKDYNYTAVFSPDGRRLVTGNLILDAVDWTLTKEEFEKQKLKRYQAWLKRNEATPKPSAPPKK